MAVEWRTVHARLVEQGLLPMAGVKEALMDHHDPLGVVAAAAGAGVRGMLNAARLNELVAAYEARTSGPVTPAAPSPVSRLLNQKSKDLARTIAPLAAPEPIDLPLRNNRPDWSSNDFPDLATDVDVDITVHFDITGNSVTEGKMSDINACFNDRLDSIRKLIVRNSRLPRKPTDIARLNAEHARYRGRDNIAVAIGLVNEPRYTKNGHLMWGLEDETGEFTCLLTKKEGEERDRVHEEIIQTGLMPDDVVGVSGTFAQNGDLFYVDDLHFPLHDRHEKAHAETGVSVAFLSDIHVGSKTFLEAQWHKMVDWFHNDPLARTIKYLILSGDCVDGVGIYPGQDRELAIPDLFNQYTEFARLLDLLPEWVECVMLPGNHDAVRPAEPQPTFEKDIQSDYHATTFVGNPCDFSLHGVRLLSYHGKSIDDFVAGLRTVTYADPVEAMRQMLRRRHLAPQWGGKTPLSPEPEDGLVIREVPDIFVTGHVHGHECVDFKGTTLVCSSTWQDQTSYQRMLGFQPRPCMLTVVNLGTHATRSIPFA